MEPIDYIKAFKLDQENYEFDREEFIQAFGEDFLSYCDTTEWGRNSETGELYYSRFKEIVKNYEVKYVSISQLRQQLAQGFTKPLSRRLWNAFFAVFVVPYRNKHFPRESQIFNKKWKETQLS